MLRVAWDRHKGGFHLAGSSFGPTYVENIVIFAEQNLNDALQAGCDILETVLLSIAH